MLSRLRKSGQIARQVTVIFTRPSQRGEANCSLDSGQSFSKGGLTASVIYPACFCKLEDTGRRMALLTMHVGDFALELPPRGQGIMDSLGWM